MKNILFRTDASSTIGTGHVMRDLVLAEQFKEDNIIFAVQDLAHNLNDTIRVRYLIETLDSNDIQEVIKIIHKHAIDIVIIDHYGIDYTYEKILKEQTEVTIFVLDDTYERHHCDILLNHNISADQVRYKGLVPEMCELRCGAEHTLLREEFIKEKRAGRPLVDPASKRVFIAMGGADHTNINIEILKVLESFDDIQIDIVTTTANAHLAKLKHYLEGKHDVTLHINSKEIARLMNHTDLAIVTPSVTMNEVYYMQVPFIAIQTAENQTGMYDFLQKKGHSVLKTFDALALEKTLKSLLHG